MEKAFRLSYFYLLHSNLWTAAIWSGKDKAVMIFLFI